MHAQFGQAVSFCSSIGVREAWLADRFFLKPSQGLASVSRSPSS
jgi:hypothetical protein